MPVRNRHVAEHNAAGRGGRRATCRARAFPIERDFGRQQCQRGKRSSCVGNDTIASPRTLLHTRGAQRFHAHCRCTIQCRNMLTLCFWQARRSAERLRWERFYRHYGWSARRTRGPKLGPGHDCPGNRSIASVHVGGPRVDILLKDGQRYYREQESPMNATTCARNETVSVSKSARAVQDAAWVHQSRAPRRRSPCPLVRGVHVDVTKSCGVWRHVPCLGSVLNNFRLMF